MSIFTSGLKNKKKGARKKTIYIPQLFVGFPFIYLGKKNGSKILKRKDVDIRGMGGRREGKRRR